MTIRKRLLLAVCGAAFFCSVIGFGWIYWPGGVWANVSPLTVLFVGSISLLIAPFLLSFAATQTAGKILGYLSAASLIGWVIFLAIHAASAWDGWLYFALEIGLLAGLLACAALTLNILRSPA
jgi:hypothetical protein